jgi:hypothetical protein
LMFLQSPKKVNQGIKSEFSDAKNWEDLTILPEDELIE